MFLGCYAVWPAVSSTWPSLWLSPARAGQKCYCDEDDGDGDDCDDNDDDVDDNDGNYVSVAQCLSDSDSSQCWQG